MHSTVVIINKLFAKLCIVPKFYKILTNTENDNPYLMLDEIEPYQIYKLRTKNLK